ncbi:uncharacterized protein LOC143777072 isoform X2 [Ranitomeya variabilis]|uniref:uncharacterized protein LOC143777072 isoform X2 n=1 Tax=Ranitomeya variabilis TaxID=490064 RepID=UPI004057CAF8
MPEYNKGSGGKKDVNGENEETNLANKKEKDGKANKKEKNIFTRFKDFLKKRKPKKKKSESNKTPQLSPTKDAWDIKEIEMESVAAIGATYHTDFEEQDEQTEVLKNLLERTKEPNIPDQQSVKACDTFPATKQIKIMTICPKDAQDPVLAQTLVTLANAMQMDPKSSKQYQQQLQFVIRLAAKSGVLEMNNIHCLLSWAKTIYPNFIRKHLYEAQLGELLSTDDIRQLVNEAQLGELLSTDEIRQLEDQYTQKQKEDLKKWWNNALEEMEKSWKQTPSSLYEISHIILKMFMGVINSAKEIPDDFVSRVMPMVESEFLQFLNRYKSSFNNYQKKNRTKSNFTEIIMTNIDYCSHFRDFVKRIGANEEEKQKMNLILQEIEKKRDNILLQNLFKDEELNVDQRSEAAWANDVIDKVADIIASDPKDLETIKQDVFALGNTCPDIRRRHVKSFLCIKKDLSNSQRISAVNILNITNLEDPQGRQLFTNIPCWPCHFLRFW